MRRETISQALDLLGERHIAYVTDKKPRAAMHTTSLSEARPAPEPGVLRRIINTAAVIVFAVGVIIGFILMRQSIGPGTTPGDSLTETDTNVSDTENNVETDAETDDTTDTKEIVELQNENYIYYVENETVTITRYIGTDPEVTIPDKIDGYPVTRIAPRQIYDENGIEDSVTATFGDEYTNVPVTKVIIPDSVIAIENYVFKDANSLKEVVFGEGITEIPSGALKNNKSLYEVTLPKSLDRFGLGVFSNSLRIIHYPYSSYNWTALLGRSDTNYWITQATIISSVDQLEENSDDLIVICYNERLTSAEFWSDPDNLVNENIPGDMHKVIAECYIAANYPGAEFELGKSETRRVRMCYNSLSYESGNADFIAEMYWQLFVASDGEEHNIVTVYQLDGYIFSVKECPKSYVYTGETAVDIVNNDPRIKYKYFLAKDAEKPAAPDGFDTLDLSSSDAVKSFLSDTSFPFEVKYEFQESVLHKHSKNKTYVICEATGTTKKRYAEFEIDFAKKTVREVARYTYEEYYELYYKALNRGESSDFDTYINYESDYVRVYYEYPESANGLSSLYVLYKETGETIKIDEESVNYDWNEYLKNHSNPSEDMVLSDSMERYLSYASVWNDRYLYYNISYDKYVFPAFTGALYDLYTQKFIDPYIGKIVETCDSRIYINSVGGTTLEKGVYYADFSDDPSKLEFIRIDCLDGYFDLNDDIYWNSSTIVSTAEDGKYLLLSDNTVDRWSEASVFILCNVEEETLTVYSFGIRFCAFLSDDDYIVAYYHSANGDDKCLYFAPIP